MVYFEAYNVPSEGYRFTYFYKKDRWLRSHKKIDRSQVTISAENVRTRDDQLFSIPLKDLEPGSYQFILQLSPRNNSDESNTIQRTIDFQIIE